MRAHGIRSLVVVGLVVATVAAAGTSCVRTDTAGRGRGTVESVEKVSGHTASEVRTRLADGGFDTRTVTSGVDTFRIVYRTPGVDGRLTTASGLLALPRTDSATLTLVSYGHGTTSIRSDVPSRSPDVWASGPAVAYASAGFAAAAPDYLGLGDGPGRHPWMDVPTETSASLDLLRASRTVVAGRHRTVHRAVMVTGFSQGASAALGLARALDAHEDPYFRLRAVAPVSGAYALRDVEIPAMLSGQVDQRMAAIYAAYLLSSWNHLHGGIYTVATEVFREPYARRVDTYFSGDTPGEVMVRGLPGTPGELLTPRAMELLRRPTGTFSRALDRADTVCDGWTPSAPVRLFSMGDDEQAVAANTDRCAALLRHRRAAVDRTTLPDGTFQGSRHLASNLAAIEPIVDWFRSIAR